jgi:hypothetical protein
VNGRATAPGGYGPTAAPGAAARGSGYPPPAPGYGPGAPPPGYPAGYQPGAPRPTQAFAPPAATPDVGTGTTTAVATAAEQKKQRDLTVNKVIAGAGAAATSAVLGSFFGAMGTVTGAALGSVFSAVVTSAMQHSLDKTRDTVKARIKIPGGGTVKVESTTEVPAPNTVAEGSSTRVFVTPGDQPTQVISAVPAVDAGPPKSRRRLLLMTGFAVVVFAIGMLAVTGIELIKGSPLNTSSSTAQRPGGTSLGSVLGNSGSGSTETSSETATTSETTSEESTTEATTTEEPTDEDGSGGLGTGFGADEDTPTTTRTTRPTPTPTPEPPSGADSGSDQGSQGDGGAAAPADQQ